ncbi:MAG TPA: DUF3611 family protein [Allocoleopsis sp.]
MPSEMPPETVSGLQIRQKLAQAFYLAGWVGFWIELVLVVVSAVILAIALFNPGFNIQLKSGIGLLSVLGGLFILGLNVYWMWRYTQLARRLPDPAHHPTPGRVRQLLHQGITFHFIGIILALIATQIIVGALLLKVLTIPEGLTIYQIRQLIEPLDIFVVQASTFMITAGCVGLLITFWLLQQVQGHD